MTDLINTLTSVTTTNHSGSLKLIDVDEAIGTQKENLKSNKYEEITVEEAYKQMGGWSRFQTFVLVITIISVNSSGLIDNGLAYLELDPVLLCYLKAAPTE